MQPYPKANLVSRASSQNGGDEKGFFVLFCFAFWNVGRFFLFLFSISVSFCAAFFFKRTKFDIRPVTRLQQGKHFKARSLRTLSFVLSCLCSLNYFFFRCPFCAQSSQTSDKFVSQFGVPHVYGCHGCDGVCRRVFSRCTSCKRMKRTLGLGQFAYDTCRSCFVFCFLYWTAAGEDVFGRHNKCALQVISAVPVDELLPVYRLQYVFK